MQFAQKTGISKNNALKIQNIERIVNKFKAVTTGFLDENIDALL